jgi:hypothetical protein
MLGPRRSIALGTGWEQTYLVSLDSGAEVHYLPLIFEFASDAIANTTLARSPAARILGSMPNSMLRLEPWSDTHWAGDPRALASGQNHNLAREISVHLMRGSEGKGPTDSAPGLRENAPPRTTFLRSST